MIDGIKIRLSGDPLLDKSLFCFTLRTRLAVLLVLLVCLCLVLSGCAWFDRKPTRIEGSALIKLAPSQYPEFTDDLAFDGLRDSALQSIVYLNKIPGDRVFWFGEDAVTAYHMKQSLEHFLEFIEETPTPEDLNRFIKTNYSAYASKGGEDTGEVLFTGYYEPELLGSLQPTEEFKYPVYSLPEDLVFVELSLFSPEFEGRKRLIGRYTDNKRVVPYYEREEITKNNLNGNSQPIAWVKDKVGLFFLEIQGSGKICLTSGGCINVHYHTSNGQPYNSIGALLILQEKIPREEMSMQKIREYLKDNPLETDEILNHNKSVVFFKVEEGGPYGCLNVKLTPGRSIALQRKIFPSASLAFIEASKPLIDGEGNIIEWKNFKRFVMNQDTGGAIRGPGRADIFWGNGPYAEITAGHMQHHGQLFFLVLKEDRIEDELLDTSR
jgi:peptidoglycan lytic transglycosylase A